MGQVEAISVGSLPKKANIMFVDDEKRVLTSMRALFRRDYNVHLANSGAEALELLEKQDMDVIVSDQRMPGMTGVDVLKACKDRAPRAMRILLTGYADKGAIESSINEGEVFRYLTKPCARETLKEALDLAVKAAGPSPAVVDEQGLAAGHSSMPQAEITEMVNCGMVESIVAPVKSTTEVRAIPTELLALSNDPQFTSGLEQVLGRRYKLHTAGSVEQAVELLDDNPIGVVIMDITVNADEVQELTSQLKHAVPELVTIVASDHPDAHRLIELINSGQVFRFLFKPIKPKQTANWIQSAVTKHLELVKNPGLVARHVVVKPSRPAGIFKLSDKIVRNVVGRVLKLRSTDHGDTSR